MAGESSLGTVLKYKVDTGNSVPTTGLQTVACVLEVDAGKQKKEVKEHKCLDQTDRYVEKISGFINAGQLSAKVSYSKAQYALLKALLAQEQPIWWLIEVPDGDAAADPPVSNSVWACKGILTELALMFPEGGDEITDDIVVELSGAPTFPPGVAEEA